MSGATPTLAGDGHGGWWRDVSSHDLRRSRATYHLLKQGVDLHTMMRLGGWSSAAAIEPCLGEPTEAKIQRALSS